ncbi:AAA family ATPase [Rhizobium etli]|uniref:AAA family ATPase n=1 Tax=Rhizobium etli TaxID=29449 RepID=UPI0003839CD8|nr:AAA family ATPase [Rhizobium etli]AGS25642.1 AAA domain-containing protein [Rhizobium etli bv. mimosae str. Mim1]
MRYVSREKVLIPKVLTSPKVNDLRAQLARYASSQDGLSRQQRAPIDHSVFEDSDILGGLFDLFERRCGYCEQRLDHYNRPPLEHHRPLGVAQDKDGRTDQYHYSWLAYEWDNMIAACEDCRKRKQNNFFVEGTRCELNAPIAELRSTESALFLDPCFDDPAEHLRFGSDGTVQPLSPKGRETISLLSLNRRDLVDARYRALNDAVGRLAEAPQGLFASPTDLLKSKASFVLAETEHPGATALALIEAASEQGRSFDDLGQMLEELGRMDLKSRRRFVEALLMGPAAEASVVEESFSLPPSRRLPGLAEMPAAKAAITTVSVRNFKGLQSIDFRLPDTVPSVDAVPCMILLGENATGKSSVLEAIALALLGTVETKALGRLIPDEDVNPGALIHRPDLVHWDKVAHEPLDVKVGFFGGQAIATLTAGGSSATFYGTEGPSKIVLAYGPRRYFSNKKTRRFRAPAYRVRSLFDAMATIANPSDWLLTCDEAEFEPAVRALREILMLEANDYFAREDGHIVIESSGGRTRLEEMSVGYKSVIAMATDIIRELLRFYDNLEYASATVLIDEIETHLHPRWKMRIMSCLRRAFPRVQFIVTTHDPLCLRGMHDGEVFVLHRPAGDRRIEKLENLPAIKGMRAEQLLTSEFFGLGSTDPETDAKLALYHELNSRRDNLDDREAQELKRLKGDLDRNLVVGDTPIEQALVDVLRQAELETRTEPSKTALPKRASILSNALQRLTNGFVSPTSLTSAEARSTNDMQGNNDGTAEA